MRRIARIVVNLVGYDVGWLVCVLSAAHGLWWVSLPAVAALVSLHAALAPHPAREVASVLAVAVVGASADTTLAAFGLLSLHGHAGASLPLLLWMAALWANFAPLLTVSLTWFRRRLALAALLGAACAPPAYLGAHALGAIEIIEPGWWLYAAVALEYAVLLPLMLVLSARMTEPRARLLGSIESAHIEPAGTRAS